MGFSREGSGFLSVEAVSWCNSSQPNHTIFIKEFDDKWLIKILQINCLSQEQRKRSNK
ncbi:hypothetical protein EMIT074MI3_12481 [Bacillus licheniformis]